MADQNTSSPFFASLGRITFGVLVGAVVIIVALWGAYELTARRDARNYFQPTTLPSASAPSQVLVSDTIMVAENRFNTNWFTLNKDAEVTVHVQLKQGPAIDAYVVDEHGLNAWQAMAANHQMSISFSYMNALSMAPLAESYTATARLAAGKYALIIDNSWAGATHPPFHILPHNYAALVEYSISAGD